MISPYTNSSILVNHIYKFIICYVNSVFKKSLLLFEYNEMNIGHFIFVYFGRNNKLLEYMLIIQRRLAYSHSMSILKTIIIFKKK